MNLSAPDALVGAIAFEHVCRQLKPQLEEDADFRGAFHVLSGFTAEQLAGFVAAKDKAGPLAQRLQLQFPAADLKEFNINPAYLTEESSVDVRNRDRTGSVVLTAEMEEDSGASLADSDRTDASDLKDKSITPIWVDYVARSVGLVLLSEERRKVEALVRGLFETGRCPTAKAGEYLVRVLRECKAGETLARLAGKALPAIGLPRSEDCFSSLNDIKMGQTANWAAKFKSHYSLECFLYRRGLSQELLDNETLRQCLSQLRSDDHQPPVPPEVLAAFENYIDSEGTRNEATERLLFDFDWNFTRQCFDLTKKSNAKDFSEKTRLALEAEGITPTPDDKLVIDALTKIGRKSGSAAEEFREFFERRRDALEKDASLYLQWEDFVHGKKVECSDLYQGIFECIQRFARGLSPVESAYLVLEGRQQRKPNHFLEHNQRACEYFERTYGGLEARTKKKIRFHDTLVVRYSKDVLPIIEDKARFRGTSKAIKAITLNFLVSVFEDCLGKTDRKIGTLSLTWKFPIGSVLAQEAMDLDALCRYRAKRKTALVECLAEYEVVGRKGVPVSLSLENAEGFAEAARSGGRGAFIPAQDRIKSLVAQWKEVLETAGARQWLPIGQLASLKEEFGRFDDVYGEALAELHASAFALEKIPALAASYRALLLIVNQVGHQDARRQLLRILLRVGLAQVQRSGRRPAMAVVCPWHPLRLEATLGRQGQVLRLLDLLLGKNRPPFSDGTKGDLFFREVEQLLKHHLYPEIATVWENTECLARVATQAFGAYTLHQPAEKADASALPALDDESTTAAATIENEMNEYLRLQPHERDNLSILLYECDSPGLPTAVVDAINRINAAREDDKITCQILLMHRNEEHLRKIYRDLVAKGVDTEADPTEASGDFLARVRVNITAANRLKREGRSQPVDLAYCRDLISGQAKPVWEWFTRETESPEKLQPHQWSRRLPVHEGERKVKLQLVCPAQTDTGWAYLYAVAFLCANGADEAWGVGKCPVLMRCLDFDEQHVDRIFRETHDLATWVINQDELLDRKLLEARGVSVIRYIQSATHGRNLIISSGARETLLINTLKEKLRSLLAADTPGDFMDDLCKRFIVDANKISGGLVLKAARRANNTNELLGMVLTRYLVLSQLGGDRPIAWCFLDDYSEWLGKKEGANIADLLVLAPKNNADGSFHLDIVVTEAKFVTHDGLGAATSTSAKQLLDTLSQLTEAMGGSAQTIDQDIWLARLSDLLVSQTVVPPGVPAFDAVAWRRAIRQRECSVSIRGYSHVFVNEPRDLSAPVSSTRGVVAGKGRASLEALQEVFGPGHVRELVVQFQGNDYRATSALRLRNGHPPFDQAKLYHLTAPSGPTGGPKNVVPAPDEPAVEPSAPAAIVPPPASPDVTSPATVAAPAPARSEQGSPGSPSALVEFLESRAATFQSSEKDGMAWLETASADVRRSLVTRGLPARLAEGAPPILTPNAGIVKLQGSKDLTVQAVEARADEIFTSEGVKIINVTPESGRVSIAVERPIRQVLHTEQVLLGYIREFATGNLGEKLFVGTREENGQPLLLDPFNQPHTLIAGITGSGKSVLLQNLILTIAVTRSPAEAHIYLIDPKFGVDYRPLDELPHVRAGSKGIIDDSVTAVETLEALVDEMNRRYELFKEAKVPNILAYRRSTGNPLPTLWVIHDEFADWMQTPNYAKAVPNIVGRLSIKARAAGIFLIFAAQRPDKDVMPMQLRSQLGNRLILKVDNAATAEIAMGVKNSGAERLLGRGHMLAKTGDMPDAIFAQVPFIDIENTIPEIVRLIRVQYGEMGELT
jgi:DNA segregation ATPase FtsK/SpoIIIE, S-DNA-T family